VDALAWSFEPVTKKTKIEEPIFEKRKSVATD
jgi:hypothetical protein